MPGGAGNLRPIRSGWLRRSEKIERGRPGFRKPSRPSATPPWPILHFKPAQRPRRRQPCSRPTDHGQPGLQLLRRMARRPDSASTGRTPPPAPARWPARVGCRDVSGVIIRRAAADLLDPDGWKPAPRSTMRWIQARYFNHAGIARSRVRARHRERALRTIWATSTTPLPPPGHARSPPSPRTLTGSAPHRRFTKLPIWLMDTRPHAAVGEKPWKPPSALARRRGFRRGLASTRSLRPR